MSVDRSQVEQLAAEGDRRAENVLGSVRNLSFELSGAQLGITVTSLIIGFLTEPTIGRALEPLIDSVGFIPDQSTLAVSLAVALALATAVQMIVGELIPKNLAIARPMGTALASGPPLQFVNRLFKYVILFLNASANRTVRLLGIEPREELSSVRSLEELNLLIKASGEEGSLPLEDYSLLARSISFGNKVAADALVPRTATAAVHRDASVKDMEKVALETGYSRFPVFGADLDDVVGVVYVKDGYAYEPALRMSTSVSTILQDPIFVPESRPLASLLVQMRRERKHMAIVIDEYGGTAGIITLEDILEELVGDIEDEYDRGAAIITPSPEGVYVMDGMLHPEEVEEATGFAMPEGDYDTLAGFLLALFDRIPRRGDHVAHDGWEFKVIHMEGRRIAKVLAVAPPTPADDDEDGTDR